MNSFTVIIGLSVYTYMFFFVPGVTLCEMTLSVMNPVRGLPSDCHKRSPLHHIDSHTTQTVTYHSGLQFPSSIALITHTQLNAVITHTQLNPIIHAL